MCQPLLEYVVENVRVPGVGAPTPALLPRQFAGRPHDYLTQLNFGRLPYEERSARPPQLSALPASALQRGRACAAM